MAIQDWLKRASTSKCVMVLTFVIRVIMMVLVMEVVMVMMTVE